MLFLFVSQFHDHYQLTTTTSVRLRTKWLWVRVPLQSFRGIFGNIPGNVQEDSGEFLILNLKLIKPTFYLERANAKLKPDPHLPKNYFSICFNESPSKMMKNVLYFILKAIFVLKIFKFWS